VSGVRYARPTPRTPGPPSAEAACRRKKPYRTRRVALSQAAILVGADTPFLRPYKCQVCRQWHLTHQPDREVTAPVSEAAT
jgi:hypothetical protein